MENPARCKTEQNRAARPLEIQVLVALCESRALRLGGVREMAVQPRKGWTKSGLQGSGTLFLSAKIKLAVISAGE